MLTFLVLFAVLWTIAPSLMVLCLPSEVPKTAAALSLLVVALKSWLVLPAVLLSPIVVPIALLFTKKEDNFLPSWAKWWDNDVSINGDQPEGAETYYAVGHDRRSFWARFVWLVGRNRASKLALDLGHTYAPGEYDDAEHWGDPLVGRDHEGWTVNRRAGLWQLYIVKRVGSKLCIRINCGHKIWANEGDHRPVAMLVNIPFSLMSWKGAEE